MEQNYYLEGDIHGSIGAIVGLIVGVGVSVMVLVLIGVMGGQTYELSYPLLDSINKNSVSGETFRPLIHKVVSLANANVWGGTLSLLNGSTPVGLGNFTVDYTAGTLNLTGTAGFNNTALAATYTWGDQSVRSSVLQSIVSGFQALQTTGQYLPIIVLAVVITLVMALILSLTATTGGGMGGSAL